MTGDHNQLTHIVACVRRATEGLRFSRHSEAVFQAQLATAIGDAWMQFVREHPLSESDRPDFMFSNGVALECKVKGSLEAHLRQMRRYAGYDEVTGVLLVAMRPYQLPETLCGKPVACLNFAPKCL